MNQIICSSVTPPFNTLDCRAKKGLSMHFPTNKGQVQCGTCPNFIAISAIP